MKNSLSAQVLLQYDILPISVLAAKSSLLIPPLLAFAYVLSPPPALEATQGQMDGFFSQLPYKFHQSRVTSVGD